MEATINIAEHFARVERETENGEKSVTLSCCTCGKTFAEDADDSELVTHLYAAHADENGDVQQKRATPVLDDQIWQYYVKEADAGRASRCRECGKLVRHPNGVACLRQHLRAHEEAYQKYLRERLDTDPKDLQMILDMPPKLARWYRKGQLTKYFEYLDTKEDRARCNTCGGSYQFKSTVANLKAHLKKVHPDQYRELRLSEGAAVEDLDAEMDDVDTEKRPQRTIDLSEYFEKYEDEEDKSVTCILCKKSFSEESETTLVGHLFAEHSEQVEVRRSRNRSRPSADAIWDFFVVISCIEQTAKCNYCEERGSFANGNAELAIHLSRAHPDHFETYMERRLDMSQSDDEQSQRNRERAQRVRRRGKRSVLWEHFDAGDGRRALCRHCGHSISYKSTTGNLWLHLRASHPRQHALIDRDKRTTGVEEPKVKEKRVRRSTRSSEAPEAAVSEWSDAWQHFSRTTGGAARCALCRRTTPPTRERMHLHLRTHHEDVWARKTQDSNNADDTICLSPSQNSDTEDHLNGNDSFANNQEDHITNDNVYTEIVYLDEEEKANRKPVKAIKRRRETLPATVEREPEPHNQLSTFINYIHCLMKQLPDDVSSKTQMEIINVIMAAKLNSEAMMATTSHSAPERKYNININTDGTSMLTQME
ncbi:hypothetical protein K1T71_014329 [Dendrolimus kikuchii]|uniref:Uncharacterized protein n=1 Tax=Dendrolimus kikuchii TaxID=765133 RepID=A0ACC1CDY4_9NEOP|nr:hypothetical protein K1T71_014329 [Dendrolimus kikuchii]